MKSIQFLGASGTVTGSSYLLTADTSQQMLVDMGMFQGTRDNEALNFVPLAFDAKTIRAVCITHAHLDHCGRLPLLVKNGFEGKIYMTEATADIARISLLDAAAIEEKDTKDPLLYTKEEVERILEKVEIVSYDTSFTLDDCTVTFRNAGHILGSASIEISDKKHTIVFSGDLGNASERLIQPATHIAQADIVIMESTYGNTIHPQQDAAVGLQKEIDIVMSTGGVLLIPAFSIERTQEVLHTLSHLLKEGKIDTSLPIFLDSPMAIAVTEVFKKFSNLYSPELSHDSHPFDFPSLACTKDTKASKDIAKAYSPKIIIAGSGMMSGGRILHHISNYIANKTTRVVIVGYQAVGTLGRAIEDGAKQIHLYGKEIPVHATITKLEAFSSHADQPQLVAWLQHIKGVKKVFLVHGEDPQRTALTQRIQKELSIHDISLPTREQTYDIN